VSTATVAAAPASLDERRLAAFCRAEGPEIFSSVVHHNQIWRPDAFDVPGIHAEARAVFDRLLGRAASVDPPEFGKILLLRGESGSGKTHLMRAFRQRVHGDGTGYFGYLQMSADVSSYARYVLVNLVDSLNHPYREPDLPDAGLNRLALGLLDAVPFLTAEDRQQFRDGYVPDLGNRVFQLADGVVIDPRFDADALDLYRILFFLLRDDNRIKGRALKWLRCEDLTPADRDLIGGLAPRNRPEDPLWMVKQLGRLMGAVHGAPLVLCLDQLEEVLTGDDKGSRFREIVETLIAVATDVPRAVAIIACLDDYYLARRESLRKPQVDRLENDPAPVVLTTARSSEEIRALAARRLEVLYDEAEVSGGPADTFPFRREHLAPLAGMRTRDVLDFCRTHRERCIAAGAWVEPKGVVPAPSPAVETALDKEWNEAKAAADTAPDSEEDRAGLLAWVVRACSAEMPDGCFFGAEADGRFVPVEVHMPDGAVDRILIGVSEKQAQGGGLRRQVAELATRAGELPAVIVRSTAFTAGPKTATTTEILQLIVPKGRGRRAVVEDSDWRAMVAFREFHARKQSTRGFSEWQRQSRPLSQLPSLRVILALDRLDARRPVATPTPATPVTTSTVSRTASAVPEVGSGALLLGTAAGVRAEAATLDPEVLKYHAAFLGATGSGKTTVALNVIEQLLLRGTPALLIDRKGDLCRYADPTAWEASASEDEARRRQLRESVEVAVFTPGNAAGRPLAVPLAPGLAELSTADREQFAGYAAAALGSMLGYKPTAAQRPRLAILGKAIEVLAAAPGSAVTLERLLQLVDERDDALLAAVNGFDDRHYRQLGEDLLTLKLSQGSLFAPGTETIDPDDLFGRGDRPRTGKARLTVVSTRFLGDAGRVDFWVAQLLVCLGRWIGKAPSNNLQAVILLDEADVYLPATRQPATKAPLEHLLRRARSAGLGMLLATQSPGDLDYKCRDNIRTWVVGRVREKVALDKLKPIFSESPVDVTARLPGQGVGEFHLLQEKKVTSFKARRSLLFTEQLPDERILELARGTRV
jgi:molybdopterin-guanine dinucleotide biosynthesis protein